MRTAGEIENILRKDVDECSARLKDAAEKLRERTSDIPSGIPSPDGALRISKAGADRKAAADDLRKALRRWHSFIVRRTVPEDHSR
jgi:hypothetical protein